MNTKKGFINSFMAMFSNIVLIIVGIIAQAIFIKILGTEYLGLNGLFTNIITMLGIFELGIGSAIVYNLYKPLKKNDTEAIKSLMNFYKKAYRTIGFIVLIVGLSIIPILPFFIKKVTIDINISLVYVLFIIDIFASYMMAYKRSILYADQRNYIINICHIICYTVMNILQLLFLYYTKDYYVYLIIKIVMRIVENFIITMIANKKYPYLCDKDVKKLDKKIEKDIFIKVKALFYHKIGSFIVFGTDSLVISKFLGLATVGLYSNYFLIISAVTTLFGQAVMALTPSVGHLLVEENTTKNFNVFKKIRFVNFWIATFASVALLIMMEPFITIWLGKKFLLENIVLIILVINFFQTMMRNSYGTFKEAAGIYHEDRFIPIFESITNIVVSIILVKLIGLPGVFIGTIISSMFLWLYSYPKFVYNKLFNRTFIDYIKELLLYLLLFISILFASYLLSRLIIVDSIYLKLIINTIIAIVFPNIVMLVVFYKTDSFIYFKNIFLKVLKKK